MTESGHLTGPQSFLGAVDTKDQNPPLHMQLVYVYVVEVDASALSERISRVWCFGLRFVLFVLFVFV